MKKSLGLFILGLFFVPFLSEAAAPTNGLTGYWKLDELSGSQSTDSSGNGTVGALVNNPTWTSGKVNGSLSFDGVDDYVNLGDSSVLESTSFTVSAWVKRSGNQNDWVKILNKGRGDAAPYASYKMEFNSSSDTVVNFHVGFTDGTAAIVQNQTPLADNVWTLLTGTFDGTTLRMYVNGTLESTNVIGSKTVNFDTVPLTLGGYAGWGYFKGNVDEVRLYNRALSDSEVSSIYLSDIPSNSNLEVYPGPGNNAYKSDLYNVEVFDGTNWLPAYVYKYSEKSSGHWHSGQTTSVNFLTLGTAGSVNVRISKISGTISNLQVSPKSKNIPVQINGGQAVITLNQNNKTWITVNGDDANPLFIFADELKPAVPSGATYFGPGVHFIAPNANNHYYAKDNEVIYLDGGAWVKGNIISKGKTNVQIMGPGVLSGEIWDPVTVQKLPWGNSFFEYFMVYASDYGVVGDTTVKGITIVDSPAYNVVNVKRVYSAKILSPWYFQTDGYNAVEVDQSFAFNGDTTFNNYMGYWNPATNSYSINTKVTNSFGGNTNNAVILGGFYGNYASANFTSTVDNMDIKTYNTNNFVQYGAPHEPSVFQVWVGEKDSSYGYKNQIYQNIRIEGNVNAPLMQLMNRVYPASWGGTMYDPPLGNSYDIKFKNITLEGQQLDGSIGKKSEIKGYDANNGFHNVLLENVSINGTVLNQSNLSNYVETNPYVWGLSFSPAPTISISASPSTVSQGGSSNLTWSATNASSCTASGSWSGNKSTSGSQLVYPTTSSTYSITCTNSGGGTATKSVMVKVSQNSPVGFWTLDQMSGTVALDTSGSGYNGSLINGTTWTSGKVSNALSFDGIDDQVKVTGANSLNSLTTLTLSSWVNTKGSGGNGGGGGTIFSKSGIVGASARFRLMMGSDGTSLQFNANYSPTAGSWKTPAGSLPLNSWRHVALVYTHGDINSVPRIYIDGVLQTLTVLSSPSGTAISDDDILYIGSRGITATSGVFHGSIDQVRVYNRELTSSEVTALYNSENSTIVPPPNPDTTPPTVSISTPINNSTVGGDAVKVSANATDNVGVVGVKFKLDGVDMDIEDTTSPYEINWNTRTSPNGNHTLSATARDLAGNQNTSSIAVVTDNLVVTPPPPIPKDKFIIGDKIKTTARVNVRSTANGKWVGTKSNGAVGTVVSGPTKAGAYVWWKVDFSTGVDGWVVETYLTKLVSTGVGISSTLQLGSTGEEVSLLQSTLMKLGYYSNGITGYFGELTQSAVRQFQTANSLEAVGIVGPKTRALILDNQ